MKKKGGKVLSGGLRLMWIGECVVFVWTITYTLTNILGYLALDMTRAGRLILLVGTLVGLVSTLAGLVGMAVGIVGLWKLRGEHTDYRNALILLVALIVCGIFLAMDLESLALILLLILGLLIPFLALLEVWMVVRATNTFLKGGKRDTLREEGKRALWARAVTTGVSLVSSILTGLLLEGTPRLVTHLVVSAAAMAVSETLYLIYLKHSSEALA